MNALVLIHLHFHGNDLHRDLACRRSAYADFPKCAVLGTVKFVCEEDVYLRFMERVASVGAF